MEIKLDVAIVTYNRLEKLQKALAAYNAQTATFRNLIVVDNCSTDGTGEFLEHWRKEKSGYNKIVITTNENLGGAGGFYLGQTKAVELDADWIFLADDDAYVEKDVFELFYNYINSHHTDDIVAICTSVLYMNGEICPFHRNRMNVDGKYAYRCRVGLEEYASSEFDIDLLSYVGAFIKTDAISRVGPVNKDYFIYNDDSEHSLRLRKAGRIVCIPKMKVYHDCEDTGTNSDTVSWKDYYLIRNQRHMLCHHLPSKVVFHSIISFFWDYGRSESKDKAYRKIYRTATWDGLLGRLGKHKTYRPGWKMDK